jgi:hypothetical protein
MTSNAFWFRGGLFAPVTEEVTAFDLPFISASRRSSCPKDPRNWSIAIRDRHDTPPAGRCAALSVIRIDAHRGVSPVGTRAAFVRSPATAGQ